MQTCMLELALHLLQVSISVFLLHTAKVFPHSYSQLVGLLWEDIPRHCVLLCVCSPTLRGKKCVLTWFSRCNMGSIPRASLSKFLKIMAPTMATCNANFHKRIVAHERVLWRFYSVWHNIWVNFSNYFIFTLSRVKKGWKTRECTGSGIMDFLQ